MTFHRKLRHCLSLFLIFYNKPTIILDYRLISLLILLFFYLIPTPTNCYDIFFLWSILFQLSSYSWNSNLYRMIIISFLRLSDLIINLFLTIYPPSILQKQAQHLKLSIRQYNFILIIKYRLFQWIDNERSHRYNPIFFITHCLILPYYQ